MDVVQILPWAVFGTITCVIWLVVQYISDRNSRASKRLDEFRNPALRNRGGEDSTAGVTAILEKAAPTLSKALVPKTELEQSQLRIKLANAGFNNPSAAQIFLAIKAIFALAGLGVGVIYGMTSHGVNQQGMTAIVLCGAAGFYAPGIVLWSIRRSRQQKIYLALPDALDLLVVCVEAGLGLDAAIQRVTEELQDMSPEICAELQTATMHMQMGRARRDVLHDLGIRTGVDDVRALAAILIQADRFGSSIGQALRVQSDSMRTKRRQIAEEKAQKTAVQMLFPLVLFIFPGIFVVLVGPAAIMMVNNLLTD